MLRGLRIELMLKEAWRENENGIRAQRVSSGFVPAKCDPHLGREEKRMQSEWIRSTRRSSVEG